MKQFRVVLVMAVLAAVVTIVGAPSAEAAGHVGDFNQITGECNTLGMLIGGRSTDGSPVVAERRRADGSVLIAAEADGRGRRVGVYTDIRSTWNGTSETCHGTSEAYTDMRLSPGTSGLAVGTPIRVRVALRIPNLLSVTFPDSFVGSGAADLRAAATLWDLAYDPYAREIVRIAADGILEMRSTGEALKYSEGYETTVSRPGEETTVTSSDGSAGTLCSTFPAGCDVRARTLTVPSPPTVDIDTRVGATLELAIELDANTYVTGGPVTPVADVSGADGTAHGMSVDIEPLGDAAGVEVVTGVAYANHAPVAVDQSLPTDGSPLEIVLDATDEDGDPLEFLAYPPERGTLSQSGRTVTYTPPDGYVGSDRFVFETWDPQNAWDEGVVTIDVVRGEVPNREPFADPRSATTAEDTPVDIALAGHDPDGDDLTYEIVDAPSAGSVTVTGSSATYRPNPDRHGPDTFTYRVSDGRGGSATALVSVEVTAVNDAPIARDAHVLLPSGAPHDFELDGSDVDGDQLRFEIVVPPNHGRLEHFSPSSHVRYTPFAGYVGPDELTFTVSDDFGRSAPARVSIDVLARNVAPTALPGSATTPEDTPVVLTLEGADPDDDHLTFEVITAPTGGTLSRTDDPQRFLYAPSPDRFGSDSFEFVARDAAGATSAPATFDLTVTAVNDAPVAVPDSFGTEYPEKTQLIGVLGNDRDVDGDAMRISSVTQPSSGAAAISPDGQFVEYTAATGWYGTTQLQYTIADPSGATSSAALTITVRPRRITIQDAPKVLEGGVAEFWLRLSTPSPTAVTVRVLTEAGTAHPGADYVPRATVVRIEPGQIFARTLVETVDDDERRHSEPEETFRVVLTEPKGAVIEDGTATATIAADPPGPFG